jgi:hypothetical protein
MLETPDFLFYYCHGLVLPYTVVGFRGPLQKSHDLEDDFPLRTH